MQNYGAALYAQTAKNSATPREFESQLLANMAARLQYISDNWTTEFASLDDALTRNRKIWTIFLTSVTQPEHPLPQTIRQNIANIGIFVLGQTLEMVHSPTREGVESLIGINRQIAAGLRETGLPT